MIPLTKPFFGKEEFEEVKKVLDSGWVAGQGPKNKELSSKMQEYLSIKHAVPVNNCTAALHLSLLSLDIKTDDEVLVSDFTFPATGHAVMYIGAIPRFIDIDKRTFNIDTNLIKEKITDKTKAIIPVHAFGRAVEMNKVMKIAKENNLFVIEDAACALGSELNGKKIGTIADIGCFSFHARKNVTSGEGGMVITDNDNYAKTINSLSCFGMESAYSRQESKEFNIPIFDKLGYNYKLSDINAAIAIIQLKRYEQIIEKRLQIVKTYEKELSDLESIQTPSLILDRSHIYQSYVCLLDKDINRNNVITKLKKRGIQSQIGTYSSFIQPVYKSKDSCPNSLFAYKQSLSLPIYYELDEKKIRFICDKLKETINGMR